jgi:hypothetical protein
VGRLFSHSVPSLLSKKYALKKPALQTEGNVSSVERMGPSKVTSFLSTALPACHRFFFFFLPQLALFFRVHINGFAELDDGQEHGRDFQLCGRLEYRTSEGHSSSPFSEM